jgi:hypothetical protein
VLLSQNRLKTKPMNVIARKNLPFSIWPYLHYVLVIYLLLDKFQAPEWLYGLLGGIAALILIALVSLVLKQKEVDLLEVPKDIKK